MIIIGRLDRLVSHEDEISLTTTSPPTDSWLVQQYILYISHIPKDPNNALLAFASKPLNSPSPFSTTPPKYYLTQKKMAASVATGVSLNHISRESSDIRRLANFYKEVSQEISSQKTFVSITKSLFFFCF